MVSCGNGLASRNNSCGCNSNTNANVSSGGTTNSGNFSMVLGVSEEINNQNNNSCGCRRTSSMNDALENFIGRKCTCEFAIGNNLVRRTGVLSEVGSDFIKLTSTNNCADHLLCNTCNLVFVRVDS